MLTFDLQPGRVLARKYEVLAQLGSGWEGEVYKIKERNTGIERAAKLFFPKRNPKNKTSKAYARRLHKLRDCPSVIQYHTEETISFQKAPITVLVSDYVEGEVLSGFLERQRGKRLHPFQALHLLDAVADSVECMHRHGEYHGDLHTDNIIVSRCGLHFDIKILDFYFHASMTQRDSKHQDICDMIRLYYDALGGARHYAKQPQAVKDICLGLKKTLIRKRFPSVTHLRAYLRKMRW